MRLPKFKSVEATNASRANTAPEVAAGPRPLYEEDVGGANGMWGEMLNSKCCAEHCLHLRFTYTLRGKCSRPAARIEPILRCRIASISPDGVLNTEVLEGRS